MSTWKEYKQTYRSEPDLFDFARTGDLRGLVDILTQQPNVDLDAKNHKGYSALMLAVYNGQKDFCEALLRSGADVNSADFTGNTVLMAAAFKGDLAVIKLLLQFGAITTLKNQSNMTARDWAVMFARTEAVNYFDEMYPDGVTSSKLTNIMRFIRLGFIMIRGRRKALMT